MKNIKLLNKILLSIGIIFIILILILFILGNIEREGYLSDFYINTDDTLKVNNINIETTKKLFSSDDKLDYSLLTNYIFTNNNISKYSYNFRIKYYSKVFRNSDIYGVYLNTNILPYYIFDVRCQEKGSPFGILVSSEIIEQEKIDNIQYSLHLKFFNLFMYLILFYIFIILLYVFRKILFNIFHYILIIFKKYKKLLLIYFIIYVLLIVSLFILGNIYREGYLSEFVINVDNTLKLNNIDIEDTKKLFFLDDKLDYSSLTNYIFTNSNISKYSYNFRISYYSKVFRNSYIYGVYLNTNSLPDFIFDVQFQEKGSPFGIFTSSKVINQKKIYNMEYFLKIKYSFFTITIILVCLFSILFYNSSFIVIDLLKLIYNMKLLKNINLKNKYVYILIIFLSFLIMPNIIYILFGQYFDKTNYEKRTKAEKPIFSINNLSKYPNEYEKYFNDYIPFRNELIQSKVYLDLVLFNNFINTRYTLIGKEDWLFMKWYPIIEQYIGNYMFTDKELEIVKKNLIDFRDKLKANNIDLVVMIVPEKSMVYDNYLPDYIQKMKYSTSITEQLVKYIRENTDIKIVYPKDELIKYRNKYQLYYKYDDHWNHLGGYIGYSELMKSININIPAIDIFDIYKTEYSDINKVMGIWNDLISLINLPPTKKYNNQYNYFISNFVTNNYQIIRGKRGPHETLECISDANDKRHITIFRDSYTCAMFDYLVSSFYRTSFIYNGNINNKGIPAGTDIVFLTMIERSIKGMLLNSIKNIKINNNLETNFISNNN